MYLGENAHEPVIGQERFGKVQRIKGQIKHAANMKMNCEFELGRQKETKFVKNW